MYARWQIRSNSWLQWSIAISAFAVPSVIALGAGRRRGPLVAVLYFGGTLLPALGFFNLFPMRYSFVADHFQYLASLGILTLIAAWWLQPRASEDTNKSTDRWLPAIAMRPRTAAAIVALLALATLTWQRQSAFKDPEAVVVGRAAKKSDQHGCEYPTGANGESQGRLWRGGTVPAHRPAQPHGRP